MSSYEYSLRALCAVCVSVFQSMIMIDGQDATNSLCRRRSSAPHTRTQHRFIDCARAHGRAGCPPTHPPCPCMRAASAARPRRSGRTRTLRVAIGEPWAELALHAHLRPRIVAKVEVEDIARREATRYGASAPKLAVEGVVPHLLPRIRTGAEDVLALGQQCI